MARSWAAFIAVSFLAMTPAAADGPLTVAPNVCVNVASTDETVTDKGARFGRLLALTGSEQPKPKTQLVYCAPNDVQQAVDTLSYKDGANLRTLSVNVQVPDPTSADSPAYGKSFLALFKLLVLAVLLESGLALLFHWKLYFTTFDPKAMNAVVSLAVAYFFVRVFHLDVVGQLLSIYSGTALLPDTDTLLGPVLTAMIVAGGSSGVNRLMQNLGIRPVSAQEAKAAKPQPTEAWLAVVPIRQKAKGPITVLICKEGEKIASAIGTIAVTRQHGWWRSFLRDRGRFPPVEGFPIQADGTKYYVSLEANGEDGRTISSATPWGPYSFFPGAIIDLELNL